jgi:hypothetical protein
MNRNRAPPINTSSSPKGSNKNIINSPYKSATFVTPKIGVLSPTSASPKVQFRKTNVTRLTKDEDLDNNGVAISSNVISAQANSPSAKTADVDYKLYENLFKTKRKAKITVGVHSTQGFRNSMEDEHFFIRDLDVKANIQTSHQTHSMFGVSKFFLHLIK